MYHVHDQICLIQSINRLQYCIYQQLHYIYIAGLMIEDIFFRLGEVTDIKRLNLAEKN